MGYYEFFLVPMCFYGFLGGSYRFVWVLMGCKVFLRDEFLWVLLCSCGSLVVFVC